MNDQVREHYQRHPYPVYPLIASVRRCDTFAVNLTALWCRFNGELPPENAHKILLAGCGAFSPYPWSVSNPETAITAMDLSSASLKRARLHCILHRRHNIAFLCGDLLDPNVAATGYGVIDAYGVLHHLHHPLDGLKALKARLIPGGIIRIMVYSRYARRDEEAIRRAFRLLGIRDPRHARALFKRAAKGSRLTRFLNKTDECDSDAGLSDALLHPRVQTFLIDDLMELIHQSGLQPLLFAHRDALENVEHEVARIREMESRRDSPGNFVIYLGNQVKGTCPPTDESHVLLNPCLKRATGYFTLGNLQLPARLGHSITPLSSQDRAILRRFSKPVPMAEINSQLTDRVKYYIRNFLLINFRPE